MSIGGRACKYVQCYISRVWLVQCICSMKVGHCDQLTQYLYSDLPQVPDWSTGTLPCSAVVDTRSVPTMQKTL